MPCNEKCSNNETQFWLWTYRKLKKIKKNGELKDHTYFDRKDFHIVSHPGYCSKCYSKNGAGPVTGPVDPAKEKPEKQTATIPANSPLAMPPFPFNNSGPRKNFSVK